MEFTRRIGFTHVPDEEVPQEIADYFAKRAKECEELLVRAFLAEMPPMSTVLVSYEPPPYRRADPPLEIKFTIPISDVW